MARGLELRAGCVPAKPVGWVRLRAVCTPLPVRTGNEALRRNVLARTSPPTTAEQTAELPNKEFLQMTLSNGLIQKLNRHAMLYTFLHGPTQRAGPDIQRRGPTQSAGARHSRGQTQRRGLTKSAGARHSPTQTVRRGPTQSAAA